ncbi:MAG: DNA repair protein RecN [Dehalococcoidales bacterium]
MLLELRVRDVGIIDEINWTLADGLNIITGETGAGKSLVIDAVEALLGAKPDEEMVRHGADEATIEGIFTLGGLAKSGELRELLEERGLTSGDDNLVVHCELRRRGRGVIRINGHAVPRAILQQIGRLLVDVHGQSEHLSLLDRRRHLIFLDAYGGCAQLRLEFAAAAAELGRVEQELTALEASRSEAARQEEFLRFQIDEITAAELHDGEDEDLERERTVLASAEKLKALSYEAYQQLYGEDAGGQSMSAVDRLSEAVAAMRRLAELDADQKPALETLEGALYGLQELAQDVRAYGDRLEHDPLRLEEIEARLDLIRNLKRKYGESIGKVLAYLGKAEEDLTGLANSSERSADLDASRSRLRQEMAATAATLSEARTTAATRLESAVENELKDLDMPRVTFLVPVSREPAEDGLPFPDGESYAFDNDGADNVEFVVSTNPGEPPRPLARIASTGEMSRFMLGLKGVLSAADNIPVLVFDEIDIGVGGRSGEVVGRKLWTLARTHQTICVTHLPQIAAFADAHFRVRKEVAGERTLSRLETLEGEARAEELAAMLAGPEPTPASLENAHELIERAANWKTG